MSPSYQLPSPSASSSDDNSSLTSIGLSRQRSDSTEFPIAKRTRPSQHQSVNEWAKTLTQADLSGLTVDSPARSNSPSLPTPASTPPNESGLARADSDSVLNPPIRAEPAAPARAESGARLGRGADEGGKDRFVAGLVGASCLAIQSLWGPADRTEGPATGSGVLPIHFFVKEVLRRSRTSCSTLQLALYYLHKSRRQIREVVAQADASRAAYLEAERHFKTAYPSPPLAPADVPASAASPDLGAKFAALLATQNSPILCGRRMFLASLIAASKYLQDRNYSNRAWARISGLAVNEINVNERIFLGMMGFQLHLKADDFARWAARLAELTPQPEQVEPVSTSVRAGIQRSASELAPAEILHEIHSSARSPPLVGASESCKVALGRSASEPNPLSTRSGSFLAPGAPRCDRISSPAESAVSTETVSSYAASSVEEASEVTSPASSISASSRKICRMPVRVAQPVPAATKEQLANTHWISGPQQRWSTFGWQAGAAH